MPCGERTVYIASPPHGIAFGPYGELTLSGSVGYKAQEKLKRQQNWCHFDMTGGTATMYPDAECPGR